MEIVKLTKNFYNDFKKLFTDYYTELDCDDDCEHLLNEYVLPDYEAELIDICLCVSGGPRGFIIFQRDDIDNDWNFKEGWGDIRELYVTPNCRNKGYGGALLSYAESKLGDNIYLLPTKESESFFIRRGYADSGEYCAELDNKVFAKTAVIK